MEKKIFTASVKELNEKGEGLAVIATLNVIDLDGDMTLPGAFGEQVVPMVPAHDWQEAPIGKARLREVGDEAQAAFQLNLKTTTGSDWYEALKFDLEHPPAKQQYSYGFTIVEAEDGIVENQRVRFLKKLTVHEISPVLLGAGVGPRALALKAAGSPDDLGLKMAEQIARSMEYLENTIARLEEIYDMRARSGRKFSAARQEDIARVKAHLARLDELLKKIESMKTSESASTGYFDLRQIGRAHV